MNMKDIPRQATSKNIRSYLGSDFNRLSAAFMAIGLESVSAKCVSASVLDLAQTGHIELVQQVTNFADMVSSVLDFIPEQDFPGVMDYEVSEPFGAWFGHFILEKKGTPTTEQAADKLATLISEFFKSDADEWNLIIEAKNLWLAQGV